MQRIVIFFSLLLASLNSVEAGPPTVNDKDMKSALIYHFALFTAWPESKEATFKICAFEEDQDNINPDIFAKQQVNGKRMQFEVMHSIEQLKSCQVLFIEDSKRLQERRVAEQLLSTPILSIADTTMRSDKEAIIKIQLEDKKYRFTIDNEAAKQHHLNLSSRLLRLASKVY